MARGGRRAERTRWPPSRSGEPTRPSPGAGDAGVFMRSRDNPIGITSPPVPWPPSIEAPWPGRGGVVWRSAPSPGRMRLLRRLATAAESAGEPPPATHSTRAEWCATACGAWPAFGRARIRQAESQWKRFSFTFAREMCESAHPTWWRDLLARSGPPKHAGYALARAVHSLPTLEAAGGSVGN
jgi:hypothetical protein